LKFLSRNESLGVPMSVISIGVDLAKSVFHVHGVDARGQAIPWRRLARRELLEFFSGLSRCLVGMEACSSSHYWAREQTRLGHDVRLIPPQYVKPYVKRNKTDAADAEAICEAVARPNMRFVPIKTPEQQAILALHRVRSLLVRQRTASINAARGLLGEFGVIAAKGTCRVVELHERVNNCASDAGPQEAREAMCRLFDQINDLQQPAKAIEACILS
jgi:transposase